MQDNSAEILKELQLANKQLRLQNALWRVLLVGVVYGIGFFIGSVILATIAFGVFGPWFGRVHWIERAFTTGTQLSR